MKKLVHLLALLFAGYAATAQKSDEKFELSGTVKGGHDRYIYLQKFDNKMLVVIDSAKISADGKYKFNTKVKLPELYGITLNPAIDLLHPFYVFLENSKITAEVDSIDSYHHSKVSGSSLQALYNEYNANPRGVKIDEFIKAHPQSLVSAYLLYRNYSYRLSAEQLEQYTALLHPSLTNTPYVKALKELPAVYRKAGVGNKAIDFVQQDVNGKTFRLSDHYGKYLFVDFWASWCPPCRAESPNLIKVYNKYKAKGFEVIGVSFDKSKKNWLKAIKDDGLPWLQVSDLTYWNNAAGKLYGVRLIPNNVLINPQGIIVGRNLHGDELEKQLEELFSTSAQKTK